MNRQNRLQKYFKEVYTMTQTKEFSQLIAVFSELRSKAETRVRIIRTLRSNEDIGKKEIQRSLLLYEDAGSAMNAWLDAVKSDVISGKIKGARSKNSDLVLIGAQKAELFLDYADTLILGEERSIEVLIKPVSDLITGLVDAGVKIWSRLREEKTEMKHLFLEQLDSLRWVEFNNVV